MIKNYFKLAWRNMQRRKLFSLVNVFGLTIGLTCCMLIALYVLHENSYDDFQENRDRVFQLGTDYFTGDKNSRGSNTAGPIAGMMQNEFPEIQHSARLMRLWNDDKTLFQVTGKGIEEKSFYESNGYLADSSVFKVLSFDFIAGNKETALLNPNSAVINEELARKLFGKSDAINQVVHISSSTHGDHDFKITGVYKKLPSATHLKVSFILSFAGGDMYSFANNNPSPVNNNMFCSYLLLKPGADAKKLENKFPAFIESHIGQQLRDMGKKRSYFLTAVQDIHLSGISDKYTAGGNKASLFILSSIALLTLLIACINFMNLSTAGSANRAAEVGVRKVLGAQKQSLLKQFLGESILMSLFALVIASVLCLLLLPVFEQVAGKQIQLSVNQVVIMGTAFLGLSILTGLIAGSYPALYLSSFQPIKVLKGKFHNSLAAASLRKGMVVFQFVISVVLIIASLVIANQMDYLKNKKLGFEKNQQLVIPLRTETSKSIIPAIKTRLQNQSDIKSTGAGMSYPGIFHPQDWSMYKEGETGTDSRRIYINMIDDQYLQTLNFSLVAGRLFSPEFPADSLSSFVINEEAVKNFGFETAENAVGKWLAFDWEGEQIQFHIVGVVKDFHFKDLKQSIEPFAFRLYNNASFNYLVVHLNNSSRIDKSISSINNTWKDLNPNEPFEYSFVDLDFQKNYESESRQASLINYFTLIAIFISCLGLFGLASFTAEQRIKEIGIRKVLGASVFGLVSLLSKDFLKLVAIAVIIASPLAWYIMNKWLQNFAFQINIGWKVFALTAFISVVIALITISFQSIKAAITNPVKNLRTE